MSNEVDGITDRTRAALPQRPWMRAVTGLLALGLAWLPMVYSVHIAVLIRSNPGAGIAISYALPFMIGSWALGVCFAVIRRGESPAASAGFWVVVVLAVLPVPLILLRVPVALAGLF